MGGEMVFRAWVPGLPKTKGSMLLRSNGTAAQSVVGSTRWAILMAEVFRREWGSREPLSGPLFVACSFVLPVSPTQQRSGDGDKLERNVWDALQPHMAKCVAGCKKHAGVISDDVLVVDWTGSRRQGEQSGVQVSIFRVEEARLRWQS